ncbi:hypothetical protein [Pontibacter chinhatensis]|uniref:Uncharacterized protein n=1 Tax=Pontibacter chinhatensis TaxID=1436961 RepID=A0A1I2P1U9_9BACT|nr:hypothetical protein [Pontibacter chinhatensis]SFG10054.1 hypothetical protein SAMN05421739_101910 [Pontibacter chinhatensis]
MKLIYSYTVLSLVVLAIILLYSKAYYHFQLRRRLNPELADAKFLHLYFNPILFYGNIGLFFPIYIKFKDFEDPETNRLQNKVMLYVNLFWISFGGVIALVFVAAILGVNEVTF